MTHSVSRYWLGLPATGHWVQVLLLVPAGIAGPPEPREFTFTSAGETHSVTSLDDADQVAAFRNFFDSHRDESISIENRTARTRLTLELATLTATRARTDADQAAQHAPLASVARAATLGQWFVRFGYDGIAIAGTWGLTAPEPLGAQPVDEAVLPAPTKLTAKQRREVLARLGTAWDEGGADDSSGEYCVFLEGRSLDEDTAERSAVLADLHMLGLSQAEPLTPGPDGEVWVRYDKHLRAEINRHI